MSESQYLAHKRNEYLYNGYQNSLVEWLCSEEWLIPYPDTGFRGTIYKTDGTTGNSASGEFIAVCLETNNVTWP